MQRQYSRTAGRIENCQLEVFLAYAVPGGGRALIDRELYLPRSWTSDRERRRQAGIGDEVGFGAKPEVARQTIEGAIDAGMPARPPSRRRERPLGAALKARTGSSHEDDVGSGPGLLV